MSLSVVTDLSTLNAGDYVKGFTDLSGNSRIFNTSPALPTVTATPDQLGYPSTADNNGPWVLKITYAVGSPDGGSWGTFTLDRFAHVIKASTSTG